MANGDSRNFYLSKGMVEHKIFIKRVYIFILFNKIIFLDKLILFLSTSINKQKIIQIF